MTGQDSSSPAVSVEAEENVVARGLGSASGGEHAEHPLDAQTPETAAPAADATASVDDPAADATASVDDPAADAWTRPGRRRD